MAHFSDDGTSYLSKIKQISWVSSCLLKRWLLKFSARCLQVLIQSGLSNDWISATPSTMATLTCISPFRYWSTCHLTARLTRELLQYMHKGTLAWAVQHGTIRSRKRPWVHWEFEGNCFLDVYFWSALANHHELGKKRPILLQLYQLNSSFHLDNLESWVLSFIFLIVNQKLTFPVSSLSSTKCVEQFSTCFTLLTEVVLDFLRHDLSGDQIIQVIVRSWILAYRKRICKALNCCY